MEDSPKDSKALAKAEDKHERELENAKALAQAEEKHKRELENALKENANKLEAGRRRLRIEMWDEARSCLKTEYYNDGWKAGRADLYRKYMKLGAARSSEACHDEVVKSGVKPHGRTMSDLLR